MAKLSDLKKLVDAARADAPLAPAPVRRRQAEGSGAAPVVALRGVAPARLADGDIDLAQAFADVQKLPPASRVNRKPPRPAADSAAAHRRRRDALAASKYGAEPTPDSVGDRARSTRPSRRSCAAASAPTS